jgi:hypothetical protein
LREVCGAVGTIAETGNARAHFSHPGMKGHKGFEKGMQWAFPQIQDDHGFLPVEICGRPESAGKECEKCGFER